ncbi:MAG: ABC transporter ATP-binding protein/permease [Oscillospiraceae bacterium]|nr:ABC transporter ATP-binding protein/permease [Oscillospiraceae bacterium]
MIYFEDGRDKRSQNFSKTIKSAGYMLGFVWKEKSGKLYLFLKVIISLVNAVFPLAYTIMPGLIINELTEERRINAIILYVGILTVAPVLSSLINAFMTYHIDKIQMELTLNLNADFYAHVADMDYETLEKPDIQTMRQRAGNTLNNFPWVANNLSILVSGIFSLIAMLSIIATLNSFIIILIIAVISANSFVAYLANQKDYLINREVSKNWRHKWAITSMFEYYQAKELRLFGLKSFAINLFAEHEKKVNKLTLKNNMMRQKTSAFNSVTGLIQQVAIYAYLIYSVIKKGLAIGSMTIYLTATQQFSNNLQRIMNSYMDFSRNSLDIQEMIEFMKIPSIQQETGDKTPVFDKNSVIEFKNVSFKYPGSENYALRDMSLTIRGDEKLCIVGANGSGKSTFIKLLTRLYMPAEGEILLNGMNINEYGYAKYQRLFAPVFQDFSRFSLSLKDNIVLTSEYGRERLEAVGAQSGLAPLVERLPKGYETQVGKQIDDEGFEPSGGEGQRIAIARAVYHGAPIYLLDEPTAALDPLAEHAIYTQFNQMITGKAAVLITHRLSAVQLADKVAVFDKGSLIEYGTHKELYGNGGTYTEMYRKQAEFFVDNT